MTTQKKTEQTTVPELTPQEARDALKYDMKTILSNTKRIMEEKGINQKKLSESIGSEESHVSRMLRKEEYKNGLTIRVLGRISRALEVSLTDLVK